jgi:hypothetical protein
VRHDHPAPAPQFVPDVLGIVGDKWPGQHLPHRHRDAQLLIVDPAPPFNDFLPDEREHADTAAEPDASYLGERPRNVAQANRDMTETRRGFRIVSQGCGFAFRAVNLSHRAILLETPPAASRAACKGTGRKPPMGQSVKHTGTILSESS